MRMWYKNVTIIHPGDILRGTVHLLEWNLNKEIPCCNVSLFFFALGLHPLTLSESQQFHHHFLAKVKVNWGRNCTSDNNLIWRLRCSITWLIYYRSCRAQGACSDRSRVFTFVLSFLIIEEQVFAQTFPVFGKIPPRLENVIQFGIRNRDWQLEQVKPEQSQL